jgi:hypothetical protein
MVCLILFTSKHFSNTKHKNALFKKHYDFHILTVKLTWLAFSVAIKRSIYLKTDPFVGQQRTQENWNSHKSRASSTVAFLLASEKRK